MPRRICHWRAGLVGLSVLFGALGPLPAVESARWRHKDCDYRRTVELDSEAEPPQVVVAEFFAHGQFTAESGELAVFARDAPVASWRLQAGPGDFVRVTFQTVPKHRAYELYYGGRTQQSTGNAALPPDWVKEAGLLLETRRYRECDLGQAEAVRQAFADSEPVGADYVDRVFHGRNPLAAEPGSFLGRYVGWLDVPVDGEYQFFTSSQDASFLYVNEELVVAAPGMHAPIAQARGGGRVRLTKGPQRFEYLLAASGADVCAVAAWQPPGVERPEVIPASAFRSASVSRVSPGDLEHRTHGAVPDFRAAVRGSVELAGAEEPLVRVEFHNESGKSLSFRAKPQWDFGDGQTSLEPQPLHVYLHPGVYAVTLDIRGAKRKSVTHRIAIAPPPRMADDKSEPDSLSEYLPLLGRMQPSRLDSPGLLQLVRALVEAERLLPAVRAGQTAFAPTAERDDETRWRLAGLLGPLLRDRLRRPDEACELWRTAAGQIKNAPQRAECAVEAADLALHELLSPEVAAPLVALATDSLGEANREWASRAQRLRGDLAARSGDAAGARAAYVAAQRLLPSAASAQQNARRGAYSRSIEAALLAEDYDQAQSLLRQWRNQFPAEWLEGYWSLLAARLHLAERRWPQAVAAAEDLLAVEPDSPYADQLLDLAAQAEQQRGNPDRAVANWRRLAESCPGSPLVAEARRRAESLRRDARSPSDRP